MHVHIGGKRMIEALTVYLVTAVLLLVFLVRDSEDNDFMDIVWLLFIALIYPISLMIGIYYGNE